MPLAVEADKILQERELLYSVCTLVTDMEEYEGMIQSFQDKGFTEANSEFLFLNNTEKNHHEAYAGLNIFLRAARGKYVILCHQDVILHDDDIHVLTRCIDELSKFDPRWALLGNAGGKCLGQLAFRITDANGEEQSLGEFPVRVQSLDENFIVVKSDANLALSGDLNGFHMYGTDLCLIASILGYSAYVVSFNLHHKSPGNKGRRDDDNPMSFYHTRDNLIEKYGRAFAPRWIYTTCTKLFVSGNKRLNKLANTSKIKRYATRYYKKRC